MNQGRKVRPAAPPGTIHIGTYLPPGLHDRIKALCKARRKTDNVDLHEWRLYAEGMQQYADSCDPATGKQVSPPGARDRHIVNLQVFGHTVASNADLIRAMNATWMMVWASVWTADQTYANLHVSPALQLYTGCSGESFKGEGWVELIHPDDRAKTWQNIQDGCGSRQPFTLEYRMRGADGNYHAIVDRAEPRYLTDRSFAGYVGTMYQIIPQSNAPIEVCWVAERHLLSAVQSANANADYVDYMSRLLAQTNPAGRPQ